MSASILIDYNQINGSICITLPMPSITIQFADQNGAINVPCTCARNNQASELIETKEDKHTKEEFTEIKEEKPIKQESIDYDNEISEYILHEDANLYQNMVSPISLSESENEEFNHLWQENFNDIPEIVQYLKHGIVLN
ncbi:unnamed protein product [Adineta ricciae]|uniref:Uncharacterized protein n=1 Tax=Adineta ricciae TaxID=249248 RepID=A0A814WK05_ADIRI|nr:unnamed protein product [Adineta ricciae]CAF1393466.1 unnamed protein product [Adineta ricciae]